MKRKTTCFLAFILLVTSLFSPSLTSAADKTSSAEALAKKLNAAIAKKSWGSAASYSKQLAVYYDDRKNYSEAVRYYDATADYWSKAGHPEWGVVNTIRADHIRTVLDVYVAVPASRTRQLAKFEPLSGTYLGMFPGDKLSKADYSKIESGYGKKHAMFLTYTSWRKTYPATNSVFPTTHANKAKEAGAALQIGWEPSNGLDDVKDDEYVRQFAREAKASGIPIFLRYACEMNGEWVPWHDDPQKYIEKFRLIHDIMAEEAPNVAMVWSPNFLPRNNIDPYYPGDSYVDWVGFSLYTIPFSHGKEVPGGSAVEYMKPLYQKYSHKPIMISEGAVSFISYEQQKDYTQWAVGQLDNMYTYLPRIFPQVKAITYFNLDKLTTNYDNQNNNYDLSASLPMLTKYKKITGDSYFLSSVVQGATDNGGLEYRPIAKATSSLKGKVKVMVYAKLPLGVHPYYVAIYQGKTKLGESYSAPWTMTIDFDKVKRNEPIKVISFDNKFQYLSTKLVNLPA